MFWASLGGTIPYAKPHTDAKELIPVLGLAANTRMLEGQVTKLRFRELLFALSIRMQHSTEIVRESSHGNLCGFEFMDIIRAPDKGSCMKSCTYIQR